MFDQNDLVFVRQSEEFCARGLKMWKPVNFFIFMYFLLDGRGVQFSYIYEIHDIYGIFNDERILGVLLLLGGWEPLNIFAESWKKKGRNFEYFEYIRNVYT